MITGADGQLGRALQETAPADIQLAVRSRAQLDLEDLACLHPALAAAQPDVVINAAAWTAVDRAEAEPARVYRVNAEAVGSIATYCAQSGCRLVQISTDFVFAGDRQTPWPTDAPTHPVNVYGRSKLAGEQAALSAGADARLVRSGWIYGEHGHNFVRTMLRLARTHDSVAVVNDQIGTPTWSHTLADFIWQLIADWPEERVWHYADAGQTSWHGFAVAIFAEAVAAGLLAHAPEVREISSADYASPAPRPAFSVLDTTRTRQHFRLQPPDWRQSLRAMLARLATDARSEH